jgi:hypothetical protein
LANEVIPLVAGPDEAYKDHLKRAVDGCDDTARIIIDVKTNERVSKRIRQWKAWLDLVSRPSGAQLHDLSPLPEISPCILVAITTFLQSGQLQEALVAEP